MSMGKKGDSTIVGLIGEGMKVEGTLHFQQAVRVDGTFKGTITGSDQLIIGVTGSVEGDVEVRRMSVLGSFSGKAKIKESMDVQEKGKVEGELSFEKNALSVALGARLSATITMPGANSTVTPISKGKEKSA